MLQFSGVFVFLLHHTSIDSQYIWQGVVCYLDLFAFRRMPKQQMTDVFSEAEEII